MFYIMYNILIQSMVTALFTDIDYVHVFYTVYVHCKAARGQKWAKDNRFNRVEVSVINKDLRKGTVEKQTSAKDNSHLCN